MAEPIATSKQVPRAKSTGFSTGFFAASVGFHILLLGIIPLCSLLFTQTTPIMRPPTFILVTPPRSTASPKPRAEQQQKQIDKASEPIPAKNKKNLSEPSKPEKKVEENTDDLEDLLSDIAEHTSEVAASDETFRYPWYLRNLQMKVEQNWRPAVENPGIFIVLAFTIFSGGNISEVRISKSCGDVYLDNLAIRAVNLSAPFGRLPPGFSGDRLDLTYTLRPVRK